jgi:hypothetical protein
MRLRLTVWVAAGTSLAVIVVGNGCASADDPPPDSTDTDGDGLTDRAELGLYGTSPVLADTDGDGWNDYAEIVTQAFDPANNPYRFNPRIADIPQQAIIFTSAPDVTVQFTVTDGTIQTFETSREATNGVTDTNGVVNHNGQSNTNSSSQTNSQETSQGASQSTSLENSQGTSTAVTSTADNTPPPPIDAGADVDAAPPPPSGGSTSVTVTTASTATRTDTTGNNVTNTIGTSTTFSPSTTVETAIDVSREEALQYSETLGQTQSFAQSHDVAASAGFVRLTAIVQNRGHVAFRVTNLTLASWLDIGGVIIPIDDLVLTEGIITQFQPFSLAAGESSGQITFVTEPVPLDRTVQVLANPGALVVDLSAYELDNPDGKSFAFNTTDMTTRTALIDIDYGGMRPEELYYVATNLEPAEPGVTAKQAFADILRMPYESDSKAGLLRLRGIGAMASGGGSWVVTRLHEQGGIDVQTTTFDPRVAPYAFDSIWLTAGDILHVTHVEPSIPPAEAAYARSSIQVPALPSIHLPALPR